MDSRLDVPIEQKTLLVWRDLRAGVLHWPCPVAKDHVIEFQVLRVFGESDDGTIEWGNDEDAMTRPTQSLAEASVYMSGGLKWDGCMNMQFDEQDRVMLHFCGKADATRIGDVLGRIYDVLGPLIPSWNP